VTPAKDSAALPSPERQAALLTLLADDDPAIAGQFWQQLVATPEDTLRWLPAHRLHADPAIRRRVREVLDFFGARAADAAFMDFVLHRGEHFDLEEAVWKFVRARTPEAPVAGYRAQLDDWAETVRERLRRPLEGAELLGELNALLFGQLGFKGNEASYYDPANSYLDRVMDRRLGIPISLCVLYLFVAKRLALPVTGIGMPGHFLCRYQTPREEYYIDAFHGGQLLTRIDCKRRLKQFATEYDDSHLLPISPRRILQRMIANLHLIHKERRDRAEADRLQRYLVALAR
jgi:regulator of sirC expression with transglutaminase-like and TPR domain